MKTLEKLIETARLKTAYFFIKRDAENVLSSKIHCININDIFDGQVNVQYSREPIDLVDYYCIDMEDKWKKSLKKAKNFFSKLVSSWLEESYELIEENELMAMISGRSFADMQKDSPQKIVFADGPLVAKLTKFSNQIEMHVEFPENNEISFSEKNRELITSSSEEKMEETWEERLNHLKNNMQLQLVSQSSLDKNYTMVDGEEVYKQLVFVKDEEAERIAVEKEKAKEIERVKRHEEWKKREEKFIQDEKFFPRNEFVGALKDWGYNFCHFAGAETLDIYEDYEIKGKDVYPSSGDWVVYDKRGLSGTYGVSHDDLSIYKVEIKKPKKHGVDYTVKPTQLCLSTEDLMHRYKWISFLVDNRTFNMDEAHPLWYWPDVASVEKSYSEEKKHLKNDPYLALYWLMHFGITMDNRYGEVKELVADMGEHEYLQDCVGFFEILEKHPNFSVDGGHNHRKDTEEYRHRFEIKRAYSVFITQSYLYASNGQSIESLWNSIRVYPQVEKYLIQRVRWLKNNLMKYDGWGEFNQLIQDIPVETFSLMGYIQTFNPEVSDKKQQALSFLEELKENSDVWSDGIDKDFAAIMIYDVREFIDNKEFLGELLDLYFHDTLTEEYAEMMQFLGRETVSRDDQKKAEQLVETIRETPEDIKDHLAGQSEKIIEKVIENLMDEPNYILKHIPYYLLAHPINDAEQYLKKLFFEKKVGSSNLERITQCMQSNPAAVRIVKKLLAHMQENEKGKLIKGKTYLAKFLGPYVHQPDVFEYITNVLQSNQADNTYLLHHIIIKELLFTYKSDSSQNTAVQFSEPQCTTVLSLLESLYEKKIRRTLDTESLNSTIEICIECCNNVHALPWLNKAKFIHSGKFLISICEAIKNMPGFAAADLIGLLFSDRPVWIYEKTFGAVVDSELHTTVLGTIKEKNDVLAAMKYFHILHCMEDDVFMFDLALIVFELLKNKTDQERKQCFECDLNLDSRVKYALLQGVISGVNSGKRKHIQDIFDMAISLTGTKPMSYLVGDRVFEEGLELEVDDLFYGMEKTLKKLQKGEFAQKTAKKKLARSKKKEKIPFDKIKDRSVAKENEIKYKARIWQNPDTSEILYMDKFYHLHYFDGRDVRQAPFKIRSILEKDTFIADGDQRQDTLLYVKPKKSVIEFIRFNDTKIGCYLCAFRPDYNRGFGDSHWFYTNLAWGFEFEMKQQADLFFKAAKEAFPLDLPAATPWFADKAGTVTRIYGGPKDTIYLNLYRKGYKYLHHPGPFHEEPTESQVRDFVDKEKEIFAQGYYPYGYEFHHIFFRKDMTLKRYLVLLAETDNPKYWNHPTDFYDYLTEWYGAVDRAFQDALVDGELCSIRFEIQEPQKETPNGINEESVVFPKAVLDFWRTCGSLVMEIDSIISMRIYNQQEVTENYEAEHQKMDRFFDKSFSESDGEKERELFRDAVPVARCETNRIDLLFVYVPEKDHYRCIPYRAGNPLGEYSEEYTLMDLLRSLMSNFFMSIRDGGAQFLSSIKIGDQPAKNQKRTYLRFKDGKSDKFSIVTMDSDNMSLFTRYGKTGVQGQLARKDFDTREELERAYQKKIDAQLKKGYTEE